MKFAKSISTHQQVKHGGPFSIPKHSEKLLDFSSNVNPLGFPNTIKKSLDLSKITIYPDQDSIELKKHLSKYLDLPTNMMTVGNGATELIYDFCKIMPKSRVLIASPTFGEYEAASRLCDSKPDFFETLCLEQDLERFIQKIPKHGIVFVCNPNNPTGELLPKNSIEQIIKAAKSKSSTVFVDECFIELTDSPEQSVIKLASKYSNLFVLRSLTKSFGLAGIRVGYGISNKNIISILDKIKIPWSVNGLAHQAGTAALKDKNFLKKTQLLIKNESQFLTDSISKLEGFTCYNSATNFILIKTKTPAKIIQKKLLQKNILVRNCSNFRGLDTRHIRIAVRTHKENQKLVSALKELS